MELRDICCGPPAIMLKKDATAMDAIAAMVENKVRSVIVDRQDTNDAYGMITITDIINDVISKGIEPRAISANDISSKPLKASNNLDLDIKWIAKKMANESVSQLAVFEAEALKCIVTDVDILKAMAKELKENHHKEGKK